PRPLTSPRFPYTTLFRSYPMMAIAAAYYYRAMKLRPSPWLVLPLVTAPLIYLLIEIGICGGIGNFIGTYRTYASLQQTLEYTVRSEEHTSELQSPYDIVC